MPENPYEPPREVGRPAKPVHWFRYVNAIVVALAVVATVSLLALLALGAAADSIPPR